MKRTLILSLVILGNSARFNVEAEAPLCDPSEIEQVSAEIILAAEQTPASPKKIKSPENDLKVQNLNQLYAPLTLEQKLRDFDYMVDLFKNFYGPLSRKKDSAHVNFENLVTETRQKIIDSDKNHGNDQDYFDIMSGFTASFRDAHTEFVRPDSRGLSLGFAVRRVVETKEDGSTVEHAVISEISRRALPEDDYPLYVGDEVLSINGQTPRELADSLSNQINWSSPKGSRDVIYPFLTQRVGFAFNLDKLIEQDTVPVVIKDRDGKTHNLHLRWLGKSLSSATQHLKANCPSGYCPLFAAATETEKPVKEQTEKKTDKENEKDESGPRLDVMPNFAANLEGCDYFKFAPRKDEEEASSDESSRKPKLKVEDPKPEEEGSEKLQNDPTSVAICKLKTEGYDKVIRVAVVPLKSFMPDENKMDYISIFSFMQKNTDAMILDTTGNPGGRLDYMASILSGLSDTTMDLGTVTIPLTRQWLEEIERQVNSAEPGSLDEARARKVLSDFMDALKAGKTELAEKEIFMSRDIMPWPKTIEGAHVFTKPLFVLTDSFNVSASEIFAGVLKSNNRGIPIGSTTQGGGGTVTDYGPFPNSDGHVRITNSLVQLKDGTFIEDRGVDPKYELRKGQDDYRYGYTNPGGYRDKVLEIVVKETLDQELIPALKNERAKIDEQLKNLSPDTKDDAAAAPSQENFMKKLAGVLSPPKEKAAPSDDQ